MSTYREKPEKTAAEFDRDLYKAFYERQRDSNKKLWIFAILTNVMWWAIFTLDKVYLCP